MRDAVMNVCGCCIYIAYSFDMLKHSHKSVNDGKMAL